MLVPLLLTGCGNDSRTVEPTADTPVRTGAVESAAEASCVEGYDEGTLAGRAWAFEGVVQEIGDPISNKDDVSDLNLSGVTFYVNQWYAGGTGETVTVDMDSPEGAQLAERTPAYDIGTRLLVSGESRWEGEPLDDPIAWGCGFTRYYDETTAAIWERAFAPT